MSHSSKATRTMIADLPEVAVEMSEEEMRLVSGGLKGQLFSCNSRAVLSLSTAARGAYATNVVTNGDWDTD